MIDSSKETVAELLLDNTAPEVVMLYVALAGVLTDSGYTSHGDQLEDLYTDYNKQIVDVLVIRDHVDAIIRNSLDVALLQCGVKLNPELQLDMLLTLSEGILLFDIGEDLDMIRRKLDNSATDVEAMCKLLEFLLAVPMDELYMAIEEVEDGFKDKVIALIEEAERIGQDGGEIETASDILMKRYEAIKLFKPDSLGGKIAHAAEVEELTLEGLYGLNIGHFIRTEDVSVAITDLYSLGALSTESFEATKQIVTECLDDLYPDTLQRSKAERARLFIENEFAQVYGVSHDQV